MGKRNFGRRRVYVLWRAVVIGHRSAPITNIRRPTLIIQFFKNFSLHPFQIVLFPPCLVVGVIHRHYGPNITMDCFQITADEILRENGIRFLMDEVLCCSLVAIHCISSFF